MELSFLRKSDPLFCPSHRPPSLSRPRIITLSSHSSPLACSPPDFQPTLSPTSLPLQITTKYPPTPTISPNASTHQPPPPSHHLIPFHTTRMPHFSKFFVHNTQCISIFTDFLAVCSFSISYSPFNINTHYLISINLVSSHTSALLPPFSFFKSLSLNPPNPSFIFQSNPSNIPSSTTLNLFS